MSSMPKNAGANPSSNEARLSKLPLWAQGRIIQLEHQLEEKEQEIQRVLGLGKSRAALDHLTHTQPLPHDRVVFDVGSKITVSVGSDSAGEFLELYASEGSLMLEARVSNVFQVRVKKR